MLLPQNSLSNSTEVIPLVQIIIIIKSRIIARIKATDVRAASREDRKMAADKDPAASKNRAETVLTAQNALCKNPNRFW